MYEQVRVQYSTHELYTPYERVNHRVPSSLKLSPVVELCRPTSRLSSMVACRSTFSQFDNACKLFPPFSCCKRNPNFRTLATSRFV